MYASNLKLINLRNHANSFYELSKETLFIGENGSGKTTILEALYILFGLRSFKKQPLSSVVTFNEEFFRIESEIKKGSFKFISFKLDAYIYYILSIDIGTTKYL